MKNISEIKARLAKFRNGDEVYQLLNNFPEAILMETESKKIIENSCLLFIDKLIKHLESKRPGKSSISNLILRLFYKHQNSGLKEIELSCYLATIQEIINRTFEGAFSNKLNVKTNEFLDLEDCEPF